MMLEFQKDAIDKNKAFGALLTDLSKIFGCLCHDCLIGKLHTSGLDTSSLNLLQDYLSNCKQRTEVDSFFSSWEDILSRVPQGPILDPLLFNIFICDIFLKLKTVYFSGYADDNNPFADVDNIKYVIRSVEKVGENLSIWFSNNQVKVNTDKCYSRY